MQMNYSELPNDRLSLNRWVQNTLGASPGGNEENRPSMGNLSGQDWRQLIQTNPVAAKQAADMASAARDSGGAPMMNYQNEINRLKQQGISFDAPAPPAGTPPIVNAPPNFDELFPNQNLGLPNVGDRYGFLDFLRQGGGQPGGGYTGAGQDVPGYTQVRSGPPPDMSMSGKQPYFTGGNGITGSPGYQDYDQQAPPLPEGMTRTMGPGFGGTLGGRGPYTQVRSDGMPGGGQGGMQFLKVLQQLMSSLGGRDFNPNAMQGMM